MVVEVGRIGAVGGLGLVSEVFETSSNRGLKDDRR